MTRSAPLGFSAIALALLFNVPYALLVQTFDYPGILRQPAIDVLTRFHDGGATLLLTWYAFTLAALALIPLAIGLSITKRQLINFPALAIGAAVTGALAGLTQATGLMRWVFVVPGLAQQATSDEPVIAATALLSFDLINAYGGVAIGEHLGQTLTAAFVIQLALMQRRVGHLGTAVIGFATSALLFLGTGEGLALALGLDGSPFSHSTIFGFLGLTVWLIATGITLIRQA